MHLKDSLTCIAGYVCAWFTPSCLGLEGMCMHGSVVHVCLPPWTNSTTNSTNSDDRGWPVKKMQSRQARGSEENGDMVTFQMSKLASSHHISDGPGVRTPKVLWRTDDRLRTASTQVWHHHPLICLITYSLNQLLYMNLNDRQLKSAKVPRYVFPGKNKVNGWVWALSLGGRSPTTWSSTWSTTVG